MANEELDEAAIEEVLTTKWLAHPYRYVGRVDSTNRLLKEEVLAGTESEPPHGAVILADYQAQGRGRLQRSWQAPPGTSLLFSVLLRPRWPAARFPWLMMLPGLATCEAIEQVAGFPAVLKWPNDVLVEQDRRWGKAGGILLEGALDTRVRQPYAILGIGVNANMSREQLPQTEFPATSLLLAGGRSVSRQALLVVLLQRLEHHYDEADRGVSPQAAWKRRLITTGQQVEVRPFGEGVTWKGMAVDVDDQGRLLVRNEQGQVRAVAAGDVSLRTSAL